MNRVSCHVFQDGAVLAGLLAALLFLPQVAPAADEDASLAALKRTVLAASPRLVEESYKRDHADPPTKEEADKMVAIIINAAISVMDQAAEFEKDFPQSRNMPAVRGALVETLASVFGSMGFPVPQNRAADLEACTRNLLRETPNDVRLYMILCRVAAASPIARQHAIYQELSHDSTPEPARAMAQGALRQLQRVGLPLDLDFTALDGRHVNLAGMKGKVVLVNFWATTCVPCVRDLPDMKRTYAKYHSQGLEIIGISLDSDREALARFLEKEGIPWPQYYEPTGATNLLARTYGIDGIPEVWLVDRQGVLRELDARNDQEKKVETLLKQ